MKRFRLLLASMLFALMLMLPLTNSAWAQEDSGATEDTTETDSTGTDPAETDTTSTDEATEDSRSGRPTQEEIDARIQSRIDAREERLTAAEERRIAGRCTGAQNKLQGAITRAENVESARMSAYDNVSAKLSQMVDRLDAASIDTTDLVAQVAEFDSMVTQFYADFDTYQQALADAAAMDCEENAEGFVAALEEARSLLEQLKTDASAIKEHVRTNILTTLGEIKDSLASDTTDGDESGAEDAASEGEGN